MDSRPRLSEVTEPDRPRKDPSEEDLPEEAKRVIKRIRLEMLRDRLMFWRTFALTLVVVNLAMFVWGAFSDEWTQGVFVGGAVAHAVIAVYTDRDLKLVTLALQKETDE